MKVNGEAATTAARGGRAAGVVGPVPEVTRALELVGARAVGGSDAAVAAVDVAVDVDVDMDVVAGPGMDVAEVVLADTFVKVVGGAGILLVEGSSFVTGGAEVGAGDSVGVSIVDAFVNIVGMIVADLASTALTIVV